MERLTKGCDVMPTERKVEEVAKKCRDLAVSNSPFNARDEHWKFVYACEKVAIQVERETRRETLLEAARIIMAPADETALGRQKRMEIAAELERRAKEENNS